ncbi:hypothetical protein HAPAU_08000 [Halalkalicoccus paucihalophilus]|jgi:predicted DCC family thiol-disulfide oxidoreductase YuxK|uniref:DUF393 domain-containing protein n=1 Tax=Halalkalicoccus paucihalophilus TaxID=1008153 RepID=A0A151AH92_9EURY|nr:hypothetical protein HAPAU_08000 [Halalkalicoccus paucihalophilus]
MASQRGYGAFVRTDSGQGEIVVVAVRAPPRLVYDDDCGFCTWCAEYADSRGVFELVGFSELSPDQRARLPPGYENCVHLLTDDAVFSCGQAVEEIGARLGPRERTAIKFFRMIPGHERLREPFYRSLADRRVLWGRFVRRG